MDDPKVAPLAYTIDQIVELVPIGRTSIFAEIKSGRLEARKIGKRTIITAQALRTYLENLPKREAAA